MSSALEVELLGVASSLAGDFDLVMRRKRRRMDAPKRRRGESGGAWSVGGEVATVAALGSMGDLFGTCDPGHSGGLQSRLMKV